ncbi:hydantoinase/oxoprolinase family protein [Novosphingobium sp. G106]|uniref:hydantoinase/oxoprolinase family protein n=1 Tax=Novosphingobium sp. G106 TaxID=2849500 RepID=UPI001C2D144A|nr:hydantoinase/oxoprolinase family protein [Novosphingobium sp. G106]MBV1689204.1 hydantoinase/oxoprolinase family protein [Novosphingobium sp. G106]
MSEVLARSLERDVLIGVDVGGTFTDAVLTLGAESFRAKSPSTYPDIGRGVLASCRLAAQAAGLELSEVLPRVRKFGLGTTAVTNVIATRGGLRVGLITTKGFEQTLRLARGRTQEADGWLKSVDAIVESGAVIGIDERIDRNGTVLKAMDPDEIVTAARRLAELGVESIAVSFVWSFLNPVHERQAVALLREALPDIPITSGSELRPVIREYERTALAVLNAYSYGAYRGVDDLANELKAEGLAAPVLLCHSGGGAISVDQAREQPVWLAASGPAAGVAAAARIAEKAGETKVLTCDLGGTSFDVAHIAGGAPARTQRGELMGFWTALPRVDVESVGAGGGSLTWIDERGMLRVGPRSAGSSPGPACYGRGGERAALTDALLVLGYIDPERFLGGTMTLDREGAVAACARLGDGLDLDAVEAAWGVREIAVAEMVKAVRARLSLHALSAPEHCLVSYGGCGALFAAEVARQAGLKRIYIPELASVLSAYGAATMDIRRERLCTMLAKLPASDPAVIERAFTEVREAAWADLAADGVPEADRLIRYEADMRFLGQRWELTVVLPSDPAIRDGGQQAEALFREEYLRRFGAAATSTKGGGVVEWVGIRAVGIGKMGDSGPTASVRAAVDNGPARPTGTRLVHLDRASQPAEITTYDATALEPGQEICGPGLIDGSDTTIWLPAGMNARVDPDRTLIIEVSR